MARQSHEQVAAAARRRLELLQRELEQAGLRRVDDPAWADPDEELPVDLPESEVVPRAGRHARPARASRPDGLGDRVRGHLPEALQGRVGLARGPVLLVAALVSVAVALTAVTVLRSSSTGEAVPTPTTPASPLASTAPSGTPTSQATAARSGSVTVDVAGKVRRPGVATLPAGSRVIDALRRAGGARGRVDLSALNLARVLVDGEQILVGRRAPPGGVAGGAAGGAAASASTGAPPATGALVNLNTATEAQLDTLPGVGPVTAQKILQWRTAHGAFSSVDELLEVDGIGEKTLADLAPLVTL